MRLAANTISLAVLVAIAAGCGQEQPGRAEPGGSVTPIGTGTGGAQSDPAKVREADYSVLFVGNSHTSFHDLPNLVCKMIRFRYPDKSVYSHIVGVGFLEDAAKSPVCRDEIASRPWKFVVLQAQKISMSGQHEYSRTEGIDLAKQAKSRGAAVYFFSEWGLKNVKGDGAKQEKVYQEMARAADVKVAPVGRAWDLALAARPEMPLHGADGNHQSELGAFLTACVLFAHITGESPTALLAFPNERIEEADRKFLIDATARAFTQAGTVKK